jgi:hypothetical protein
MPRWPLIQEKNDGINRAKNIPEAQLGASWAQKPVEGSGQAEIQGKHNRMRFIA